jgi:hypothetical protein
MGTRSTEQKNNSSTKKKYISSPFVYTFHFQITITSVIYKQYYTASNTQALLQTQKQTNAQPPKVKTAFDRP